MSHLIKRFKEDLQLAGYAKRSIESYVSSVLRLQRFYIKPYLLGVESLFFNIATMNLVA